jgi:hypothetical protein
MDSRGPSLRAVLTGPVDRTPLTPLTDAAARELLVAFVQLLESLERSNIAQYREQCDVVEERIGKLREMLATLSRDL